MCRIGRLDLDLRSDLDDLLGWQTEMRAGALGIALHESEQAFAPADHSGIAGEGRMASCPTK